MTPAFATWKVLYFSYTLLGPLGHPTVRTYPIDTLPSATLCEMEAQSLRETLSRMHLPPRLQTPTRGRVVKFTFWCQK